MNKIKNILTLAWHGIKIFLHLAGKKNQADKMEKIEKNYE